MATQGTRIADKKLAAIQAEYEAGVVTKSNIAKKYRINRLTLLRNAKKFGWEYGKSNANVTRDITKKAAAKIVENESLKLIDYTTKHLEELEKIRTISRLNAQSLAKELKDTQNNISKVEAERIFTAQKVCKIISETLSIIYRDERLAMGLDKQEAAAKMAVNINTPADLNKLSDTELYAIIKDADQDGTD